MVMNAREIKWVQETFKTGHFWGPDNEDLWNVKYSDIPNLSFNHSLVRRAIQSRTRFQVYPYAEFVAEAHSRLPNFDGESGEAVNRLLDLERCWVPDNTPPPGVDFLCDDSDVETICRQMQADQTLPQVGSGNWKRCHNIGEFHSAIVRVNQSGIGSHLKPLFIQVLKNVQNAYAQMGQWFVFVDTNGKDLLTGKPVTGNPNIDFTFVSRSNGWIGLAIVGQNQVCTSRIWCKYLASYRGVSVVTEWTTLIKHELGHNCGRGHTRGGVMNSSIVSGLPILWTPSDPSYTWLQGRFGGEPVKDVDPPPPPPETIENRVKQLESQQAVNDVRFAIHDSLIEYLLRANEN